MPSDSAILKHLLISASAGSGKTYQLVRRYLHLLALGQEAEGIAAMPSFYALGAIILIVGSSVVIPFLRRASKRKTNGEQGVLGNGGQAC